MSPAKFNLQSWNSNSSKLSALATTEHLQDADPETKVLGLQWNAKDDVLKLQEKGLTTTTTIEKVTKRDVLRQSSKIYDPLGILSPVSIRAKIFIQELWEHGYDWDEPLPDEMQNKWIGLSKNLESATRIQIQRKYFPLLPVWPSNVTLHIFVDASFKAYGTVAYLASGPHSTMVMSKTRVAPLKKLTLPQLELMAADSWPQWDPKTVILQSSVHDDPETTHVTPPHSDKPQPSPPSPSNSTIRQVIAHTQFSDLQRLIRTTAWVIRFTNVLRKRSTYRSQTLNADEINHAKNVWIREIQSKAYSSELANLQQTNVPRVPLVRQLRLFILEDNIIRCGGRIHNAPVKHSAKFPILLPANDHLTTLVVNDAHKTALHSGLNHTLTHVRQRYWIPKARQFIKKLLRRCVTCRKVNGQPYRAPTPPPLPAFRLVDSHPFTVTGVDFTGAIYVKTPQVSDNASTYQSAADELTQLFNSPELETRLSLRGIVWKFIPKRAPWYGGFWERLIGLTKLSLKKVLGRANITLEELQTISTEIEAVLNDRPLTYTSSELSDEDPLTPSHLLYGRRITTLPHLLYDDDPNDPSYHPEPTRIEIQAKRRSDLL
ncbi:uncharacterized protein LOC114530168 [Dendronephthya gigantea]|uniref:uncharacterized protein LOC114530168 n=1 Tax=Dendronephthya gigantea TaxID=151771 RepID=UPI00106C9DEE|nr:uncharacterized protein LOC114530168 [Dendronephthya gigantea]